MARRKWAPHPARPSKNTPLHSLALYRRAASIRGMVPRALLASLVLPAAFATAGVITDGSLGAAGAIGKTGNDFPIPSTLGTRAGGNLFHSFTTFDLTAGDSATFSGPADITNILARVTGGSESNIDGTLRSTIPGANLFLMNPKGFLFGPNAALDISGSFAVTTADVLKLSDGGRFHAVPSPTTDSLTSAPVSAFGFLSDSAALVRFDGTRITTATGKNLSLIAGKIVLDAATLAAPSGRLSMVSTAAKGSVPIILGKLTNARGAITLKNKSSANINGPGGGGILIRGGKLQVTGGSRIESENNGPTRGGDIDVRLAGAITLHDGQISAGILGSGRGGNMQIRADTITIDGRGLPERVDSDVDNGFLANVAHTASGRGGNVSISAHALHIIEGGVVSTTTYGSGPSGDLHIDVSHISLDARNTPSFSGIYADTDRGDSGKGSAVSMCADDISITGGGVIAARSYGFGQGGSIDVQTNILAIDGQTTRFDNGIFSEVSSRGNGGDIHVIADRLDLRAGGQISSVTFGSGKAGNIAVTAGNAYLDDQNLGKFTGILANAGSDATGAAGAVQFQGNDLTIVEGGRIAAIGFGAGNPGTISVAVDHLTLASKDGDVFTGLNTTTHSNSLERAGGISIRASTIQITNASINAESFGRQRGADLSIRADVFTIEGDNSGISAATYGIGDTGDISVRAKTFNISGRSTATTVGIIADVEADATGNGGDVFVRAREINLFGLAEISASTFGDGDGGTINVVADRILVDGTNLHGFSGIGVGVEPHASGQSGDLSIRSHDLFIVGGGEISANSFGQGDGGNIDVSSDRILIDGMTSPVLTGITVGVTETGIGNGGDILIHSQDLSIIGGGEISASTSGRGDGGSVRVTSGRLRIDGTDSRFVTGVLARVSSTGTGRGGDIFIHSDDLSILAHGEIDATTSGQGIGGSIQVDADRLLIDGAGFTSFTGIGAQVSSTGTGRGGNIFVHSDNLSILAHGVIDAGTFGHGDGGSIQVVANRLLIDGEGIGGFTGIGAQVENTGIGKGGDIFVHSNNLSILAHGVIAATTFGHGDGGTVVVDATQLRIAGSDPNNTTGIFANSRSAFGNGGSIVVRNAVMDVVGAGALVEAGAFDLGESGSVRIEVGSVRLDDGASVSVLSERSGGGSIDISARERIELHGGSSITASAAADGGSIFIAARDLFYLDHSFLSATAGSVLNVGATGTGGNITVDPTFIILDHANISANAAIGQGGNILLVADNFLSSNSALTATGSTAGTVEIAAPELDLSSGLVTLSASLVDASTRLQDRCTMRLGMATSSLLMIGRGGVSLTAEDPVP